MAQWLEDELGDEQPSFIDTCHRDREELPRPDTSEPSWTQLHTNHGEATAIAALRYAPP